MLDDTKVYSDGDPYVSARDLNTFGDLVRIIRNLTGLDCFVDSSGIHLRPPTFAPSTLVVRLTDSPSTDFYNWKEVTPKADGTYVDVTGGRTSADVGTALAPAAGTSYTTGATDGDVVTIRRAFDQDTGDPIWVIVGSTAAPGLKFGVLQGAWTPGSNTVTLAPCAGPTSSTLTGDPNVTVNIQFPIAQPAPSFGGNAGDILGYQAIGGGLYILVGAPVLPRAGGAFQVLTNQGGTTSNWQPDHVRAAAV